MFDVILMFTLERKQSRLLLEAALRDKGRRKSCSNTPVSVTAIGKRLKGATQDRLKAGNHFRRGESLRSVMWVTTFMDKLLCKSG